jgi:NitT/TauT family transport system permease protein
MAVARQETQVSRDGSVQYGILIARIILGAVLIALWEFAARTWGSAWTSTPSLIFERFIIWVQTDLFRHIFVTLAEMAIGLAIGVTGGTALGLLLGRSYVLGTVLRPVVIGLYSVPLITMAPLLILWFGLDMEPKIVLVALSSFFLLFFNAFSGVQSLDKDVVLTLRLMGGSPGEEFRKVILPGAMAWIMSGIKIALPYAFAAAVTGELLAAREGMGSLISKAAAQFDMTGLYTALLVLTIMGIVTSALVDVLERGLLKWRHVAG